MAMEVRVFGRTGLQLSMLGFGCGAVGGLMVRGDPLDQERTISRAIAAGVNYFDTAVQYGNGESERNLGRILQRLKPPNAVVGTKVRLPSASFDRIVDAVATSLEGSLVRLHCDRVDILHLHNAITETGGGEALSVRQVLGDVVPAFERLRQQGKARFLGLTAIGDTRALHQVIDAGTFDSAQIVYNMLNPSAATVLPPNYPAQDYGRLIDRTRAAGVGVIGIRVLAGGALSGLTDRHPIASPPPEPIVGLELWRRCLASPPSVAADKGRICYKSHRSRHAVCNLASGDRNHPRRHGNAATIRGCTGCGPKRSVASRCARSTVRDITRLRRGAALIAECM
jgi:L-galactose dehydrogenase/L-glyceraldehyde 3-phosphate reductase